MNIETSNEGQVITEERDELLLMEIDRPQKLNGFTPKMLYELGEAYTKLESGGFRCGLLHARGENFTAGLDLPTIAPFMKEGRELIPNKFVDPFNLRAPLRNVPLIAAVKGYCYTIGIELMLAADIVISSVRTRFCQLEVQRGLMATGGATIRMVERTGWGNAMNILLTGNQFDASAALRMNFVQEVVDDGEELKRAVEIAEKVSEQAPMAVQETMKSARIALNYGPTIASNEFSGVQRKLAVSKDAAEGVRSFEEKRRPVFHGN